MDYESRFRQHLERFVLHWTAALVRFPCAGELVAQNVDHLFGEGRAVAVAADAASAWLVRLRAFAPGVVDRCAFDVAIVAGFESPIGGWF